MVKEVDFDKLLEVCDDLTDYNGKLPLLIRAVVMKKYSKKLLKKGIYNEVMSECVNTKPHTYDEAVQELSEWVQENKEYKNLIINKKK